MSDKTNGTKICIYGKLEGKNVWHNKQSTILFYSTFLLPVICLAGYCVLNIFIWMQQGWASYGETMTYINKLQSEGTLVFLLFSFTSFEFLFQDKACFFSAFMC